MGKTTSCHLNGQLARRYCSLAENSGIARYRSFQRHVGYASEAETEKKKELFPFFLNFQSPCTFPVLCLSITISCCCATAVKLETKQLGESNVRVACAVSNHSVAILEVQRIFACTSNMATEWLKTALATCFTAVALQHEIVMCQSEKGRFWIVTNPVFTRC